jgi:hypothetical protein
VLELRPVAFVQRILNARAVQAYQSIGFGRQPVFRNNAVHLAIIAAENPNVGEENKQAQQQHDADHGADGCDHLGPDAMNAVPGQRLSESTSDGPPHG